MEDYFLHQSNWFYSYIQLKEIFKYDNYTFRNLKSIHIRIGLISYIIKMFYLIDLIEDNLKWLLNFFFNSVWNQKSILEDFFNK